MVWTVSTARLQEGYNQGPQYKEKGPGTNECTIQQPISRNVDLKRSLSTRESQKRRQVFRVAETG